MNKQIYVCEDSVDGIFSAIYNIYLDTCKGKVTHENCEIIAGQIGNYELFADYNYIATDYESSKKVSKAITERFGYEAYEAFVYAASCDDEDKATIIYKCMRIGLAMKDSFKLLNYWTDETVVRLLKLYKKASNEYGRMREFLQFSELANGVLYSCIGPTCDVVEFLGPHFSNRLPNENFIIHDEIRDKYLIHKAGNGYVLLKGDNLNIDKSLFDIKSDKEEFFRELFKVFTETIAIKERENRKLQQQFIPKRIQKYKVEF